MSAEPSDVSFFGMPIISDQEYPYNEVKDSVAITAEPVDQYALEISISDSSFATLLTMAGALVSFIPSGGFDTFNLYTFYPRLPPLSPGSGFLVQQVVPWDVVKLKEVLPTGVPPPQLIVYLNVDPASVRSSVELSVRLLPLEVIKQHAEPGDSNSEDYVTSYLKKYERGGVSIFLPGGVPIGKPASQKFVLFFSAGPEDTDGLSPIPFLRNLPDFGGASWNLHPLLDAVAGLKVPVDIYLQFKVWENQDGGFQPVADGKLVDVKDFDVIFDDRLGTAASAGGDGLVHFNFADLQSIQNEKPDLYFLLHLGTDNPDRPDLPDDWSSHDWLFLGLVSTGSGYYKDFEGTRLGNSGQPLLFRVGLGFWADLISFRPSESIQHRLEATSCSVQHIEDAGGDPDRNPDINLDYYPVIIEDMPTVNGKSLSAEELLNYIRTNINEFADTNLFEFSLNDPDADQAAWESAGPSSLESLEGLLGTILHIDLYLLWFINVDDGSVVVSDISTDQFTFSTIFTLDDLFHPVSGNRQFGFTILADGRWAFFTRGADRPATMDDDDLSSFEFRGADQGWKGFQTGLFKFVNKHGGKASMGEAISSRYPWDFVKQRYWRPTTNWI